MDDKSIDENIEKRATSLEISSDEKKLFGMNCEANDKRKSLTMNKLLERFWEIIQTNYISVPKAPEIKETDKILMGFELTIENWGQLNQYVSNETMKGNKILKTDVMRFVMKKYLDNLGFFEE